MLIRIIALAAAVASGAAAPAPSPVVSPVTTLDWMAGSWAGTAGRFAHEEHWTSPAGGAMVGMHRTIATGKMVEFEFLRIEEQEGTLVYLSMPGGRSPATRFTLASQQAARVVFENPAHDFPQRVIYWKDGAALRARIEGTMNGKPRAMEWRWEPSSITAKPETPPGR